MLCIWSFYNFTMYMYGFWWLSVMYAGNRLSSDVLHMTIHVHRKQTEYVMGGWGGGHHQKVSTPIFNTCIMSVFEKSFCMQGGITSCPITTEKEREREWEREREKEREREMTHYNEIYLYEEKDCDLHVKKKTSTEHMMFISVGSKKGGGVAKPTCRKMCCRR